MVREQPVLMAVVDVETTGFSPKVDRVVEVAAILTTLDGEVVEQFTTLVNPLRHVSATEIHGLTATLLSTAPRFQQLASDLAHFLSRARVLAGHNVAFDLRMLNAEFNRVQLHFPHRPSVCTMALAGGGRLDYCCELYGIRLRRDIHAALEDAQATARLLAALLRDNPLQRNYIASLPAPAQLPPPSTPAKLITREKSLEVVCRTPAFIRELLDRADRGGPYEDESESALAYANLLERAMEDRCFSALETQALTELADSLNMEGGLVRAVHRRLLDRLIQSYLDDKVLEAHELTDLKDVARLLGLMHELEGRISAMRDCAKDIAKREPAADASLSGLSVCFTGEIDQPFRGQRVTRVEVENLANQAGLLVKESVTKKLDLLVCADAATESGKARKARVYGIRTMHAAEFLRQLQTLLGAAQSVKQ
jgi:DNA polymerase-3 subunit epsilon